MLTIYTDKFEIYIQPLFPTLNSSLQSITVYKDNSVYGQFRGDLSSPSELFARMEIKHPLETIPEYLAQLNLPLSKIGYANLVFDITPEECFEIQHIFAEAAKWHEFW